MNNILSPQAYSLRNLMTAVMVVASMFFTSASFAYQGGIDGIDGNPGTDGGTGRAGDDADGSFVSEFRMHAFAGDGESGGNGGNGVAGDGADAAGGDGGHGGVGGRASGIWGDPDNLIDYRNIYARGGHGSNGGLAGFGTTAELDGRGGDGGDGGDAIARTDSYLKSSAVSAIGGNGGNATGTGAVAGRGGGASVSSFANPILENSTPSIFATQTGGNGGIGFGGAQAGAGASVQFGASGSPFSFNDDGIFASRNLFLNATGGAGGYADGGGQAGVAGDAVIDLSAIRSQIGDKRAESFRYDLFTTGGDGGSAYVDLPGQASGAAGGDALVNGSAQFDNAFGGTLYFGATGGNGGAAEGAANTGDGGDGGQARLSRVVMNAGENTLGSNNYNATLNGGNGGSAGGSGIGGNGASVNFDDLFTFDLQGKTGGNRIRVDAIGGDGGAGANNGNGGSANVDINNAVAEPDRYTPPRSQHSIRAKAIGGDAGLGLDPLNQANGGDATISIFQQTNVSASLYAEAVGGIGNNGKSGDATADSRVISTGKRGTGDLAVFYAVSAQSVAKFTPYQQTGASPRIGTISNASANAYAEEDVNTSAYATAWSGWGSEESGRAVARSRAVNVAQGNATAVSSSFSVGDRIGSNNNNALSISSSISNGGSAEADANSRSLGHFNRSIATAFSRGTDAYSRSVSTTLTSSWAHDARVSSEARYTGNSGVNSNVVTQSHSTFRTGQFIQTAGLDANSELVLAPTTNFTNPLFAGTSVADVFTTGTDVLGVGRFSGGSANGDSFNGSMSIESHVDVSFEVLDRQVDQNMMMALFDVESTGDGFESMFFRARYNDNLIIDESFGSLAAATTFFDEAIFDMGSLNNTSQVADWGFDFIMLTAGEDDSFGFKFAFGNASPVGGANKGPLAFGGGSFSAVPEPSGVVLIGLTMIGLINQRRRRSNLV